MASVKSQLAKSDRADCFRAEAQFCVAVLGIVGGLSQSSIIGEVIGHDFGFRYVQYWIAIAAGSASLVLSDIGYRYVRFSTEHNRRITRTTLQELAPAILTTAGLTAVITLFRYDSVSLLPGIWAIGLGLAIFATLERFGKCGFWLALFYLLAGFLVIAISDGESAFHPAIMGAIFGGGHVISGVMFFMQRYSGD